LCACPCGGVPSDVEDDHLGWIYMMNDNRAA
jgi:hypothetical protein